MRGNFPAQSAAVRRAPAALPPETIFGADFTGGFDYRSASMLGALWTDQAGIADLAGGGGIADPVAGAPLGGRATLLFDGTNSYQQGGNLSQRIAANAGAIWVVGRSGVLSAGSGNPQNEPSTWSAAGGWAGATLTNASGPQGWAWDTGFRNTPAVAPYADATPFSQRWSKSAALVRHDITGQAQSTIACGNVGSLAVLFRVGITWGGTVHLNFEIAALYTTNVDPSAPQIAQMNAWILATFGVAS